MGKNAIQALQVRNGGTHVDLNVGSCTWRCYIRSVIEPSLSLGPVARKF